MDDKQCCKKLETNEIPFYQTLIAHWTYFVVNFDNNQEYPDNNQYLEFLVLFPDGEVAGVQWELLLASSLAGGTGGESPHEILKEIMKLY